MNGTTLEYRQNSSGGTNSNWGDWYSLLSAGNYTDYTVTKTGSGASGTWGISITGNAATATSATSATTATKVGNSSIWLYANNNNEINFGGTNNGTNIYIGYRATDSRPIPTKFIFGSSTGTADLQAKTIYLGSGTASYITNTQYTGNAATATKATQDKNGNDITTKYVTVDTEQTISNHKTFSNLVTFKDSTGSEYCNINYN